MDIIKINAGGTIFHTTKKTLEKSAVLGAFINFAINNNQSINENEFFIDEDPEIFRKVLNRLRHPIVIVDGITNINEDEEKKMIQYYDYYNIEYNNQHICYINHDITFNNYKFLSHFSNIHSLIINIHNKYNWNMSIFLNNTIFETSSILEKNNIFFERSPNTNIYILKKNIIKKLKPNIKYNINIRINIPEKIEYELYNSKMTIITYDFF